jgi:hypothetical protein
LLIAMFTLSCCQCLHCFGFRKVVFLQQNSLPLSYSLLFPHVPAMWQSHDPWDESTWRFHPSLKPLCAAPTLPKTALLRRQSSQRLISLHLRVGESPTGQPPFLPQVPPRPTFRFRDAITARGGSMPAPRTLLLGLQSPPIYGDPSLTKTYIIIVSFSIVAF